MKMTIMMMTAIMIKEDEEHAGNDNGDKKEMTMRVPLGCFVWTAWQHTCFLS